MILIINTAAPDKIILALVKNGCLFAELNVKVEPYRGRRDKVLPSISQLLKKNKITPDDLRGIIAVVGPGLFTSLRIGVITANTLSFALKIPAAGIRLDEFKNLEELAEVGLKKLARLKRAKKNKIILPFYGKEPNITKAKKH